MADTELQELQRLQDEVCLCSMSDFYQISHWPSRPDPGCSGTFLGTFLGFRGLRVYSYCPFSCDTENEAADAILVLSILINRSYFQLIAWKSGIYRVTASAVGYLSAYTVFLELIKQPSLR